MRLPSRVCNLWRPAVPLVLAGFAVAVATVRFSNTYRAAGTVAREAGVPAPQRIGGKEMLEVEIALRLLKFTCGRLGQETIIELIEVYESQRVQAGKDANELATSLRALWKDHDDAVNSEVAPFQEDTTPAGKGERLVQPYTRNEPASAEQGASRLATFLPVARNLAWFEKNKERLMSLERRILDLEDRQTEIAAKLDVLYNEKERRILAGDWNFQEEKTMQAERMNAGVRPK